MALTLQTLLEGIYASVIEAGRFVSAQHFKIFESYFEKKTIDDEFLGKTEVYVPRLIAMAYSKVVDGKETFDVYEAPAATLIPLSTLAIETLEIEFEAKLTNFGEPRDEGRVTGDDVASGDDDGVIKRTFDQLKDFAGDIEVMMKGGDFDSSTSPAKVKVTFKLRDPPEGVSLIQEQLLDYLRN